MQLGGGENSGRGMGGRTVVLEEEKQFLLPILAFKMGSTERFWIVGMKAFRFGIGFWPFRSDFSMVETHVLGELGKRVTLEWWSVVRLNCCWDTMRG